MMTGRFLPSTHDITISTEDLRKTTNQNICMWKHMNVEEIANSFVGDDGEVVLIRKMFDTPDIWCSKEWIARKLGEQRKITFTILQPLLEVIQIFR